MGLFGDEFLYGKWVLIFLCITQFITFCSGSVGPILQMTGNEKVFRNINIIATIINIFSNIILIPKYGINGAAISYLIRFFTFFKYLKCNNYKKDLIFILYITLIF